MIMMVIIIIKIEKGSFGGEDNIDAAISVDVTLRSGVLFPRPLEWDVHINPLMKSE